VLRDLKAEHDVNVFGMLYQIPGTVTKRLSPLRPDSFNGGRVDINGERGHRLLRVQAPKTQQMPAGQVPHTHDRHRPKLPGHILAQGHLKRVEGSMVNHQVLGPYLVIRPNVGQVRNDLLQSRDQTGQTLLSRCCVD